MKDWKWLLPFALLLCVLMLPAKTEAASPVQLYLNGKKLSPEVAPKIVNDLAIVPLRIISEEVGARVSWIPEGSRIKVEQGATAIELQIGNPVVVLNGTRMTLDAAPENVEGNTIVPVRFFSESFGLNVGFDDLTRSVILFKPVDQANPPGSTAPPATGNGGTTGTPAGGTNGSSGGKPDAGGTAGSNGSGTGTGSGKPDETSSGSKPATGNGGTPGSTGSGTGSTGSNSGNVNAGSSGKPGTSGNGASGSGSQTGTGGSSDGSGNGKPGSAITFAKLEFSGDELLIQTTGGVKPEIMFLSSPERLVVDLPNVVLSGTTLAALNPKGGEFAVKHPVLQKVRYAQNKADVARIVLDLAQKSDYKLVEEKATNTYRIKLVSKRIKVVIDAGHGGSDPGAISLNNHKEKDFTLALEAKVVDRLKLMPELDVYETRAGDTYPTLQERVDFANNMKADLFLSLHANKFDNPAVGGTETYYNRPDSIAFAKLLHDRLMPVTGLGDRGVKEGDYKVIRETTMPAVLLEMGFLSNKSDEALLYSGEFQDRAAAAIAAAIKEYLLGS